MISQNNTKELIYQDYLSGKNVAELANKYRTATRTIYNWIKVENWDAFRPATPLKLLEKRLADLVEKENKTASELDELRLILNSIERLQKIEAKYTAEDDKKPARKAKHNDLSGITKDEILECLKNGLFEYQLSLWESRTERNRFILKSRQIGLTYYFAKEAFCDAILTGKNKIFLSASRAQAENFRLYIKAFCFDWFKIELKGKDNMVVRTETGDVTFFFLSTNSATAQSYHGDVYIDEAFWIPKFSTLKKAAKAMASQKKYTTTLFSTPTTTTHEAYPLWIGDEFNERNKKTNKNLVDFPSVAEMRKSGVRCADTYWRRVITLDDAEKMGCDLFDKEQLKIEYSPEEYAQLFDCQFVNVSNAVFDFNQLQNCTVDATDWKDFKRYEDRPFASNPVWIGYDPSRYRDGACIVILAPPKNSGGIFRVLEKITLKNCTWEDQAEQLKIITEKFNVEYIGIDRTGCGEGVFEQVKTFFPAAEGIFYTIEQKTKLVLKMQSLVSKGRIKWDAAYSDIVSGFLHIHRFVTQDNNISFKASRSEQTGHADAAWAIMHATNKEALITSNIRRPSITFN